MFVLYTYICIYLRIKDFRSVENSEDSNSQPSQNYYVQIIIIILISSKLILLLYVDNDQ